MLKCVADYRNLGLGMHVVAGEILRDLSEDQEQWFLRDAPACFTVYEEPEADAQRRVQAAALDTPPMHTMMERERTMRESSERDPAPAPTPELPTPEPEPEPEPAPEAAPAAAETPAATSSAAAPAQTPSPSQAGRRSAR
jgi:hypothetical protein